jgi:C4-dicarboxylate-specific signal transduction histidine kinase
MILHLNVVEDPEGAPSLFVAQFEDHTEQLQAAAEARAGRERLARVDRISMVGEMASGIAHEVNQPLSAIANYSRALARMMKQHGIEDPDLLETADKLHSQARRAAEIIRRIREFVSKNRMERESLHVNAILEEVAALAGIDNGRHDTPIALEPAPGLPTISFDRIQLQQVILNLVRNAMEADPHGRIILRSRPTDEGAVWVEVVDRGPGIPAEIEASLFEPFFSTKGDGMGMGLAISRSIVESQGGRLSFVRNPEGGVTFRIQLPAEQEARQ